MALTSSSSDKMQRFLQHRQGPEAAQNVFMESTGPLFSEDLEPVGWTVQVFNVFKDGLHSLLEKHLAIFDHLDIKNPSFLHSNRVSCILICAHCLLPGHGHRREEPDSVIAHATGPCATVPPCLAPQSGQPSVYLSIWLNGLYFTNSSMRIVWEMVLKAFLMWRWTSAALSLSNMPVSSL